jgi:hypothetical protein
MRLETNRHLDELQIEKYSMGDASEEESSQYEEHLLICESCQNRVTTSDNYVSAMRGASAQIRRGDGTPQVVHRHIPRPILSLALAASVLLLAALGFRWTSLSGKFASADVEPGFDVSLVATRGNGIEAKVPTGKALILHLNLEGLQPESVYNLEMVDHQGKQVWKGSATPIDLRASALVPRMPAGLYFLRTYAPSGKLLREYGLEVQSQ